MPLIKKRTFEIVPSLSLALADKLTEVPRPTTRFVPGLTKDTAGGLFELMVMATALEAVEIPALSVATANRL